MQYCCIQVTNHIPIFNYYLIPALVKHNWKDIGLTYIPFSLSFEALNRYMSEIMSQYI